MSSPGKYVIPNLYSSPFCINPGIDSTTLTTKSSNPVPFSVVLPLTSRALGYSDDTYCIKDPLILKSRLLPD
jgi:hypothetical protein